MLSLGCIVLGYRLIKAKTFCLLPRAHSSDTLDLIYIDLMLRSIPTPTHYTQVTSVVILGITIAMIDILTIEWLNLSFSYILK